MKWLILMVVAALNSSVSLAAMTHEYQPNFAIRAWLSATDMNRIELEGQSIAEVIGDESRYQLISDRQGLRIFILPKVPVGESFNISLITTSGQVQEIRLTAGNIEGQSILIGFSTQNNKALEHKEIADMLRAMKSGHKGKYYVEENNAKIVPNRMGSNLASLTIFKKKTYRFGELLGVILSVKNKSKTDVYLSEQDFSKIFTGTIATNIESNLLRLGSKGLVLVVTRERSDD
jgi:NOL1/NOP2/fmu family ribosome biogenesis protein